MGDEQVKVSMNRGVHTCDPTPSQQDARKWTLKRNHKAPARQTSSETELLEKDSQKDKATGQQKLKKKNWHVERQPE